MEQMGVGGRLGRGAHRMEITVSIVHGEKRTLHLGIDCAAAQSTAVAAKRHALEVLAVQEPR